MGKEPAWLGEIPPSSVKWDENFYMNVIPTDQDGNIFDNLTCIGVTC